MNSHLKSAHNYGVKKALEKCGYESPEALAQDVQDLGLIPEEKTAEAANTDALSSLRNKLG